MASPRALRPQDNEHVRELLRATINRDFEGVASRCATKFGVSHTIISEILSGNRGAGWKVLQALSQHTGITIDDILSGRHDLRREVVERRGGDTIGQHPQFQSAARELQDRLARRGGTADPAVLDEVAGMSLSRAMPVLSVAFLLRLYEAVLQAREDNWQDPEIEGGANVTGVRGAQG